MSLNNRNQRTYTQQAYSNHFLYPLKSGQTYPWTSLRFTSNGCNVIMVVVNRLSKYAYFITVSHPYTAGKIANSFLTNIYKLHGMPTIVTDRDPTFTSNFWKEFFKLQGTTLRYSSAYHPQTDGQSEIVNKMVEQFLRYFSLDKPKGWANWLALAEFWYNTIVHTSTKLTPFESVYGTPPPKLLKYTPSTTNIQAVDETLKSIEEILAILKANIQMAQDRMKKLFDSTVQNALSRLEILFISVSDHIGSIRCYNGIQ